MVPNKSWAAWTLTLLLLWLPHLTLQQLPPWDNQLFDFGWEPYLPTIQQCSNIGLHWGTRKTANPLPQPPYTLRVFGTAFKTPLIIDAGQSQAFNWQVNLPPSGGPYVVSMTDANGYTGGTSLVFDVTAGGSCGSPSWNTNGAFTISHSASTPQCGTLDINVNGGQAPYTMQAIVEETPPKTINITDAPLEYLIDIKAGLRFFLAVTDATGQTVVDGINTSANPADPKAASCVNLATTVSVGQIQTTYAANDAHLASFMPTKSSPGNAGTTSTGASGDGNPTNLNVGAIAGGVAGGVVLLAIIAFLLWRYFRQSSQTLMPPPHFDLDGTSGLHPPYQPSSVPVLGHPHNPYSDAAHPGYTYQAVPHSPAFTHPMSEYNVGMASGSHAAALPPGAQSPTSQRMATPFSKRDQVARPQTPPPPQYEA